MLLVVIIGITAFVAYSQGTSTDLARQRRTDEALAQAKAALLGYAVGRPLDVTVQERRLGELPCPDRDNDGDADLKCDTEATRIGRLPWRTLGLPDLRDADGERLWYAVSIIHGANDPRTTCNHPEDAGCLNSDAAGSITVRNSAGTIIHDAVPHEPPTYRGAIAVIIAPGAALTRQGGATQVRKEAADILAPVNYLDVARNEDNADFTDYGTNGFISGPVRDDATGEIVSNDRMVTVSYDDLMPALEKRVSQEVVACLDAYAAANHGRYPWAADITASGVTRNYSDTTGALTGRIPDSMNKSRDSSGATMSTTWPTAPACYFGQSLRWWNEWKLRVFYSVADSYKPAVTTPVLPCSSCLMVYKDSAAVTDVKYVIALSGKRLQGVAGNQPRTTTLGVAPETLGNPANFLELENKDMFSLSGLFELRAGPYTPSFNDTVAYR